MAPRWALLVAEAFDKKSLNEALNAGIAWTAIKALSAKKVKPGLRQRVIRRVQAGGLAAARIVDYLDQEVAPTQHNPSVERATEVLDTLDGRLDALSRSVERLHCVIGDVSDNSKRELYAKIIETDTKMAHCQKVWQTMVGKARRRRP